METNAAGRFLGQGETISIFLCPNSMKNEANRFDLLADRNRRSIVFRLSTFSASSTQHATRAFLFYGKKDRQSYTGIFTAALASLLVTL